MHSYLSYNLGEEGTGVVEDDPGNEVDLSYILSERFEFFSY